MAKRKSAMQLIHENMENVNPRYHMLCSEISDIYEAARGDAYKMIIYGFFFGYIKGQRAEKARKAART